MGCIPKNNREAIMLEMMPAMMEGIDINGFMVKATREIIKDITIDDILLYLKTIPTENQHLNNLMQQFHQKQLMQNMMTKIYQSSRDFDETVTAIRARAPQFGWKIDIRDLQNTYLDNHILEMTRMTIVYFCNPTGGYAIVQDDRRKPMSIMMPMGVSVYETENNNVEIAAWNMGLMAAMFDGETRQVLEEGALNLDKTLEGIVKASKENLQAVTT